MKRFAHSGKTAVADPPVVNPVQIQVALRSIPVEVRVVAVTIQVPPYRTIVRNIAYTTTP